MRYALFPESHAAHEATLRTVVVPVIDFPAPERDSRSPWPQDYSVPRAVATLEALARGLGWRVRLQYSRGHGMHAAHGTPLPAAHWSGVRMHCGRPCGHAAYAVYREPIGGTGKGWASMRHTQGSFRILDELRQWLRGGHTDADGDATA